MNNINIYEPAIDSTSFAMFVRTNKLKEMSYVVDDWPHWDGRLLNIACR